MPRNRKDSTRGWMGRAFPAPMTSGLGTVRSAQTAVRWRSCLLVLLLFVVSCAQFNPVAQAPEFSLPPSSAPLWQTVDGDGSENWHVLLNEGLHALDVRLDAIDSATEQIDLQTFLWHFDLAGALVLDHLIKAADRGVRVRILVDDTFLAREDTVLLALADHPEIEYRVFNPFQRRQGSIVTRQLLNIAEFHRLDHRMHNKSMIVDNRVAIIGGRNLANEYFGLHTDSNFRDLDVLLGGPVVRNASDSFDQYWNDRWSVPIEQLSHSLPEPLELEDIRHYTRGTSALHKDLPDRELTAKWQALRAQADGGETRLLVDIPPEDNPASPDEAPIQVAEELAQLFAQAQREIIIITAYLIPTPVLESVVREALGRGVRIRILTNSISSNNHLVAHGAYQTHVNTLLGIGVEMHEVRIDARDRPRYMIEPVSSKRLALHAKALVFDDTRVFIGSANLDPRSLKLNTEMGLLIESEAFNQELRQAVGVDFHSENAWRLELQDNGRIDWVSGDERRSAQPADSEFQRLEAWFYSLLPIDHEL